MNSSLSFFIIYGWISGPGHGRELTKLLQAQGLTKSRDAASADIIITHSAGFHLIPKNTAAKLVVCVGPTLDDLTVTNWVRANLENAKMFWRDRQIIKGLWLTILHVTDLFIRLRHNRRVAVAAAKINIPELASRCTVIIANRDDPWPHPRQLSDFISEHPWAFMSLPGAHENIWEEPTKYVEVVTHYAKIFLA